MRWGLEYIPPEAIVAYATAISSGVVSHEPRARERMAGSGEVMPSFSGAS